MAYYIDLFSPETYDTFGRSQRNVSGFRIRHRKAAEKVRSGDIFVCYLTRLSRWFGLLEVEDGPYIDNESIFVSETDPFVVRFHVRTMAWLDITKAVPIHDSKVWDTLSFTRELPKGSLAWTGKVRGSLVRLDDQDGKFLAQLLTSQVGGNTMYPLSDHDTRRLTTHTVIRTDKVVTVSVPEEITADSLDEALPETEARESIRVQALLAQIGTQMGMTIWLPRGDRVAVLKEWKSDGAHVLDRLPLNYDDTTLRTIEQIDVLWLKGRSIIRAFEVEHTTSVYSGILRMADLLALQPNMDIKVHIVAPEAKREKVFQEIRRPVFSLLERGPLADSCTYLSYGSVRELVKQKHLAYLSDSVLDEYAEEAE